MTLETSYDYRSKPDLVEFKTSLEASTSIAQKAQIATEMIRVGLMVPKLGMRLGLKALSAVRGEEVGYAAFAQALSQKPSAVEDLWSQSMQHVLNGRDLFDPASAGGLSQPELAQMLEICQRFGWMPPPERISYELTEDDEPTPGMRF